jgi:hypothetical protein
MNCPRDCSCRGNLPAEPQPIDVEAWPSTTLAMTISAIALIMVAFNIAIWRIG